MTQITRLDIDLAFTLAPSSATAAGTIGSAAGSATESATASGDSSDQMTGTVKAAGRAIEIYSDRPELVVSRGMRLKDLRVVAADLAERGLSVSLRGPQGLIVQVGAVTPPVVQRLLTGSKHIVLGSRAALTPLLRRRSRRGAAPTPTVPLPPATLFPLVPTFDRRIRRRVTTTHYLPGAGRPRLIFVVGSENWDGRMPREFNLLPTVTTIGSAPDADLRLEGLQPVHAEIRHDRNDEYVLVALGPMAGGARQEVRLGQPAGQVLRTGARIELGPWRMAFFREEYADHGRPYGGRLGGELSYQKPQPSRRNATAEQSGLSGAGAAAPQDRLAAQNRAATSDADVPLDDSEI